MLSVETLRNAFYKVAFLAHFVNVLHPVCSAGVAWMTCGLVTGTSTWQWRKIARDQTKAGVVLPSSLNTPPLNPLWFPLVTPPLPQREQPPLHLAAPSLGPLPAGVTPMKTPSTAPSVPLLPSHPRTQIHCLSTLESTRWGSHDLLDLHCLLVTGSGGDPRGVTGARQVYRVCRVIIVYRASAVSGPISGL